MDEDNISHYTQMRIDESSSDFQRAIDWSRRFFGKEKIRVIAEDFPFEVIPKQPKPR